MILKNVLILVSLVVVGGLVWLLGVHTSTTPSGDVSPGTVVSQNDHTYKEETDTYTIRITYPLIENTNAKKVIEAFVEGQVDTFKSESVSLITEEEAARIREFDRPYALVVEYKTYTAGSYVSYVFSGYLDTGGAHPNSFFRTVTFDSLGNDVALGDLFVQGAPYLSKLSEEAYTRVLADLRARTGGEVTPDMEDTVRLGTAPSPETLQFFYLSGDYLHLLFPPYQVAAYAAGTFDVAIPLSELKDIVRTDML